MSSLGFYTLHYVNFVMRSLTTKINIPFCLLAIAFCSLILASGFSDVTAAEKGNEEAGESANLSEDIQAIREKIDKYQQELDEREEQEKDLFSDISLLEKDIAKMELQIKETELVINSLNVEIEDKRLEIKDVEKDVAVKKKDLSKFLQELYKLGQDSPLEIILGNQNFSDYFSESNSLETFEDRTKDVHEQLIFLMEGLKNQKEQLLDKKAEQVMLKNMQLDQQEALDDEMKIKNLLMSQVRSDKEKLSKELVQLNAKLDALQSLGKPIILEDAVKAAKYASKLTGVRPEFLLGVLRVESALGTNVGGGRYKTDMNPKQWKTFKKICKELKLDPDDVPVSRRVCYNRDSKDGCGGWGGAMGPAQFMPSTWMGYKSRVEKITGKFPANPWNLKDSLLAMGLKLAAVDGVTKGKKKAERKAAGIYLAGANWEKFSWYSDRVMFYAKAYKKVLEDY